MAATEMSAENRAMMLGAKETHHVINWSWATGFPSHLNAEAFVDWLERNGYEHRGIYDDKLDGFAVRFRRS